ncbi:uncharacterized protein LOC116289936 [Actinia tenebrosa]|uniref:Uncharacterized protein LOC116289936 n=1 Tax=Actinia tenebrosa TaxID=6105 RepID=A0A6P8HAU9_ACTTE|nr:uncharacterized protein LOC116289936 [Actinia tenebrosa]
MYERRSYLKLGYDMLSNTFFQVVMLIAITISQASSETLRREKGEDAVFMFNTNTSILDVSWGIRDGNTSRFKLVLIAKDTSSEKLTPNADYAERVSFVGNLTKGQAWFKITNLNIHDTNQYMAEIVAKGTPSGQYDYIFITLIVTKRGSLLV